MPSFKAPQYTKVINPKTGNQEPCYIFNIEYATNEEGISYLADSHTDITLQLLQKAVIDNVSWWNNFIEKFLESSIKLFSKPYTVENINKITKHTLIGTSSNKFPANITFLPKSIQICGGVFMVNWQYIVESVVIDIPDVTETENNKIELTSLPDSGTEGVEELNMDDLPVDKNTTEDALEIDSPVRFYEKQRVREARLKAKLAVYKAQRQMAQYYQKYGEDISDSETESEYTTSDEETEDVQL